MVRLADGQHYLRPVDLGAQPTGLLLDPRLLQGRSVPKSESGGHTDFKWSRPKLTARLEYA